MIPASRTPLPTVSQTTIISEIIIVLVFSASLIALCQFSFPVFGLSDYVGISIALIFLIVSVQVAERDARGAQHYGLRLQSFAWPIVFRELVVALLVMALVFPPYALLFFAWHGKPFALSNFPHNFYVAILSQVALIALPEEFFFRGYLQTRLSDIFPKRTAIGNLHFSWPALFLQAALFALFHLLTDLSVARLAVFFPGLLFGLLRDWRKGLGACIVVHATSNLLASWLALNLD